MDLFFAFFLPRCSFNRVRGKGIDSVTKYSKRRHMLYSILRRESYDLGPE